MKRSIYTGLHYAMLPMVVGRLKWLARKHPGYGENIRQRFGYANAPDENPIWIHAVSVGETIAAEPLVKEIQRNHPEWPIIITNTTPTGADQARRLFGESISQQFAPYDLPAVIERYIERVKPRALVVMETELWPNWIEILRRKHIPILVANARLSEKSAAGYARLGSMASGMMASLTKVCPQYEADAQRFISLGVPESSITVTGNIKADIRITDADKQIAVTEKAAFGSVRSPVLIAASTHPGEDEIILDALLKIRRKLPDALLYLAPRHVDRAPDIELLLRERSLEYSKRSESDVATKQSAAVVLCDQMGELRGLFGAADIALMGGTLVDHGGHNPLEPAAWEMPIFAGPSQRNFDSLFREMEAAEALLRVDASADSIEKNVVKLWSDDQRRKRVGAAALSYLQAQRGAVNRILREIESLVD